MADVKTMELTASEFIEWFGDPELDEQDEQDEQYPDKVSTWVKDKDLYMPSTDISIINKLPPGTYKILDTQDRGLHCQKLEVETDNLYIFTDSIVNNLLNEINLFWEKKDIYKKYNLIHKRGVLLSGFPGTGKTSLIDLISKELIKREGIIFKVDGPSNFGAYLNFMKHGFKKIEVNTPVITILEDLEQYVEVESKLLDFLDGQHQFGYHLVIATSNNTEEIPDSFLRPSRIDLKIEIDYPSEITRREFFKFKGTPDDILEELVEATNECTFADLKEIFICHFVLDYSITDAVEKVKNPFIKKDYTNFSKKRSKVGF